MTQITKGDVVSFPADDGRETGIVSAISHDKANGIDRAVIENDDGSWSYPPVSECAFIKKGNPFFQ